MNTSELHVRPKLQLVPGCERRRGGKAREKAETDSQPRVGRSLSVFPARQLARAWFEALTEASRLQSEALSRESAGCQLGPPRAGAQGQLCSSLSPTRLFIPTRLHSLAHQSPECGSPRLRTSHSGTPRHHARRPRAPPDEQRVTPSTRPRRLGWRRPGAAQAHCEAPGSVGRRQRGRRESLLLPRGHHSARGVGQPSHTGGWTGAALLRGCCAAQK